MEKFNPEEKLRKSVLKYLKEHTISETASFFELGTATVSRWKSQYENEGSLLPRKRSDDTYFSVVDNKGKQFFISAIEEKNDITLEELRQKYLENFNRHVSTLKNNQLAK